MLVVMCASAIDLVNPVDILGDGVVHAIGTTEIARWVQFYPAKTNTGQVRVGNSIISATRGMVLDPGAPYMLPTIPAPMPGYALSNVYYYVAVGDKLNIQWGK